MKFWEKVILTLIASSGPILAAIMSSSNSSSLSALMSQINNNIIPRLQDSDDEFRERIARLETLLAVEKKVEPVEVYSMGLNNMKLLSLPNPTPKPVKRAPIPMLTGQ